MACGAIDLLEYCASLHGGRRKRRLGRRGKKTHEIRKAIDVGLAGYGVGRILGISHGIVLRQQLLIAIGSILVGKKSRLVIPDLSDIGISGKCQQRRLRSYFQPKRPTLSTFVATSEDDGGLPGDAVHRHFMDIRR